MKKEKMTIIISARCAGLFRCAIAIFIAHVWGATAFGQITGTVFRDYNGNGTREIAEPLVAGVTVELYNSAGALCGSTTTSAAAAPNYSVTGTCSGDVRVEFVIPSGSCQLDNGIDFSGLSGNAYGSSVQFVTMPASNVNFALFYPGDYGGGPGTVPKIYNIMMRSGDPVPASTPPSGDLSYTANMVSVVATGYFADGPYFANGGEMYASTEAQRQVDHTPLALAGQTGTLWGNVYSERANRLFVSAFTRRHCGMGPAGPGGIYMINPTTPSLSGSILFANLDALGFATHAASGAYQVKSNAVRGLPAQPAFTPTTDADAYDQVGKTSLGDIDLSDDGRYLFVTNLFDRKIYRIDLQNAENPVAPTAAQISSYSIPDPCGGIANAGDYRPFALKVYRGKLYVGITCSGQDAANPSPPGFQNSGMRFFVYEFDLGSNNTPASPVSVYSQGVTYRDADEIQASGNPPSGFGSARWSPWSNTFTTSENHPMVVDLEFDNKGNLYLGVTDRNGYQTGGGNNNLVGSAPFTKGYANGDILKLNKTGACTYTPATGSYYQNDLYQDQARWCSPVTVSDPYCHGETGLGGLAIFHFGDRDEVVIPVLNPIRDVSNGYAAFDNTTGAQLRANELYFSPCDANSQACLWKSGGVGDIEVFSSTPPLEIGNRVWNDTDNDGVQDAGEAGIGSVTIELYADFDNNGTPDGAALATTSTATNGSWYFNTANVTDGDPGVAGNQAGPQPEKRYLIRIGAADWTGGVGVGDLAGLSLTSSNIGGAGQPDVRDNDATLVSTIPTISYLTGKSGHNDHTLDMGFAPAACAITNLTVANRSSCNNNGTVGNTGDDWITADVAVTFSDPPATGNLVLSGDVLAGGGATSVTVATAGAGPTYTFTGVRLRADGTPIVVTATFDAQPACTFTNSTIPAEPPCSTCPTIPCGDTDVTKN